MCFISSSYGSSPTVREGVDSVTTPSLTVGLLPPLIEMIEKFRIARGDLAVHLQTDVSPSANPIAVMQVGVSRVAVSDIGFVITTARTDGPRPAGMAFGLAMDAAALKEIGLNVSVNACSEMTQFVCIGIDEAVAGRDVARRRHAQQPESRAAGMRFADAGVQFLQCVLDV